MIYLQKQDIIARLKSIDQESPDIRSFEQEVQGLISDIESGEYDCDIHSSRPALKPDAPKFNSTDLILLAHDEWKRREERKHNHPENHWCSGFINGFMTDKQWARDLLDKMHRDAEEKCGGAP